MERISPHGGCVVKVGESMGQAPIRAAGHVLRHVVGVLLLSWVRALRVGFIAGLAGALLVELAAMVMTSRFPPDGTAQLVAGLFGCALAFGAAATVVVDEILEGMRELVGVLAGEAEAGARVAATLVEREVGESSASVLRLVGLGSLLGQHPTPATPPPPVTAAPALASAAPRREMERTDETLAELADEPFAPAQPRPEAGPVPADQLPRLAWTDELPVVRPTPATPATPATPMEPPSPTPAEKPAAAAPANEQPLAPSGEPAGLAEPSQWHAPEQAAPDGFAWHDPMEAAEPEDDEESYIQPIDVFGALPPLAQGRGAEPLTRPLPETTRPLPASALETAFTPDASSPRGSVWDHISQVLAGRPVAPLPDDAAADPAAQDAAGAEGEASELDR